MEVASLRRYPWQPNRVMSVGVFNICNYTLRNVHASVYNRPGFEMNSTGRMDLPPEQGIVVAVDSYVQWGSSTCGELWEPINGGCTCGAGTAWSAPERRSGTVLRERSSP